MSHTNPTASADAVVLPVRQAQELLRAAEAVNERLMRVHRALETKIGDPNVPAPMAETVHLSLLMSDLQALLPKVEVPWSEEQTEYLGNLMTNATNHAAGAASYSNQSPMDRVLDGMRNALPGRSKA